MLDQAEIARRKPVWVVLSDLWLDTELQDGDLRAMAVRLRASGYGVEELRGIYLYEVAPVVYLNLLSPAGVWTAFDPAWICAEAEKRARKRSAFTEWRLDRMRRLMTYATEPLWDRLTVLLADLEDGASNE